MIFRKLELILSNGEIINMALPDFNGYSHVDSEEEFIEMLKKYSKGLKNLRTRKPELSMGKIKVFVTLDEQMHSIVNARKYVDGNFIIASTLMIQQKFTLDLMRGTCVIYDVHDQEVGTLYLDAIFDNWKELFHPDLYPVVKAEVFELGSSSEEFEPEECEEHIEDEDDDKTEPLGPYLTMMAGRLTSEAYELWLHAMLLDADQNSGDMKYIIRYSGSGDSGQIDDIIVRVSDTENHSELTEKLAGSDDFDNLIWRLIQAHEDGFYNNEGGYGSIEFTKSTFSWEHHNYIEHTECTIAWDINVDTE